MSKRNRIVSKNAIFVVSYKTSNGVINNNRPFWNISTTTENINGGNSPVHGDGRGFVATVIVVNDDDGWKLHFKIITSIAAVAAADDDEFDEHNDNDDEYDGDDDDDGGGGIDYFTCKTNNKDKSVYLFMIVFILNNSWQMFLCYITMILIYSLMLNNVGTLISVMSLSFFVISAVYNISDALAEVIADKDALITAADDLTTAMNDLGTDIDTTKSTCSASSAGCQTACDTFDTIALKSGSADFSSVSCVFLLLTVVFLFY